MRSAMSPAPRRRGPTLGLVASLVVAVLALVPVRAPAQPGGGIAVIVRATSAVRVTSMNELRVIFGGRARSIQGVQVVPLNLPPEDGLRRAFDAAVLGLQPDRIARFWIDARIRDGSQAPRTVPNAATMIRAVAALPNGIGYVPESSALTGVKVVGRIRDGRMEAP